MHFSKVLAGAAALLSTSVQGAFIPAAAVEASLEARNYRPDYYYQQCQNEIRNRHDYKFCKTFFPSLS
jgi:hypothetical protein